MSDKNKNYYEEHATEEEFLNWYETKDTKTYEKPSNTVDLVTFRYDKNRGAVQLLLIKRKQHPFKDKWALAGGFINKGESAEEAVVRETKEETGLDIDVNHLDQLRTYTTPDRDPRGWVNSVAYLVYTSGKVNSELQAGDDAVEAEWFDVFVDEDNKLRIVNEQLNLSITGSDLAFDHEDIIMEAVKRVRGQLDYKPNIYKILGDTFAMKEALTVYSNFVPKYKNVSKSSFRTTHSKNLVEAGYESEVKTGRPAKLYKVKDEYDDDLSF